MSRAEAKNFARTFAEVLAQAEPDRFTINSRKDVRAGRIFIDYLRNDETASAIAADSVRARLKSVPTAVFRRGPASFAYTACRLTHVVRPAAEQRGRG
jgi:DNA primase